MTFSPLLTLEKKKKPLKNRSLKWMRKENGFHPLQRDAFGKDSLVRYKPISHLCPKNEPSAVKKNQQLKKQNQRKCLCAWLFRRIVQWLRLEVTSGDCLVKPLQDLCGPLLDLAGEPVKQRFYITFQVWLVRKDHFPPSACCQHFT